ncbi:MAG: HlyC/CorC family transporter [Planctomycetes bacterium]|nr:HlyC/CorC family transporter [Planctomycetota bacterium]
MCSAAFSASETAFFSLGAQDPDKSVSDKVARLMREPRELLVSLLAGNLMVNVFFFSIASHTLPGDSLRAGFFALLAILICGEIVPKTLALRMPAGVARFSAPFWGPYVRLMGPVRSAVNGFLNASLRILGESERREVGVSLDTLAVALEQSAAEGSLAHGEADLLGEIIQLSTLRVREIMTPRVDVLALDLEESAQEHKAVVEQARRQRITWLPVVRGDMDSVVGAVSLRELFTQADRPLDQLVMPVPFVPEVAPVLAMMNVLRNARAAEAVVVDEWGGTAGVVSLEDLFEEVVGDLRAEGEDVVREVIPMGEGRYRVSGDLSIREWNETMGLEVVPSAFETLGGYILAILGRLPKTGERIELGAGLMGEVHEVRGRRVITVDLFLEDQVLEDLP